jgi:NAD(P)-dependent dehydrogenase (short-subunit alcohol dehydrogenase family)
MRLKDKVIIVTGSTTGIGRAIALRAVEEGAYVVVHGLEKEEGESVLGEIEKGRAVLHTCDLAHEETHAGLIDFAVRSFGKLSALVNNAAWVVSSAIDSTDPAFLRRVLEVNTVAPFSLIKHALPYLQNERGCVLNIGSVNAYCGESNLLAYSVSKGALMTLTRNLGDSLHREHRVRVNQLNPGWVLTEREQKRKSDQGLPPDWYKNISHVYAPSGRLLVPEEIAAASVYWLSDECGPVSGQVVELEQHPFIGRNPSKDLTALK